MVQSNFEIALCNAYKQYEKKSLKHRPQRTDSCPTLARFAEALDRGWSLSERSHVSECEYCQKIMLFEWRLNPPGIWPLVEFVAGVLTDRRSMQMYLEENPAYARLQRSVVVKSLARLVCELKGLGEFTMDSGPIADLAGLFALEFSAVPVRTRGSAAQSNMEGEEEETLQRVRAYANSISVASPLNGNSDKKNYQLALAPPDGNISIELEIEEGQLAITASSPVIENAGRSLIVDVLPEGGPSVTVEVRMEEDRSAGRALGTAVTRIGSGKALGDFSVMAAWIPEADPQRAI